MAGRISGSTERALRRIAAGERPIDAARAEGVDPSTLWRARKRGVAAASGRFVIVGAGALGREVKLWIGQCRSEPIVFLDDHAGGPGVLGNVESYVRCEGDAVLVAIADGKLREAVTDRFTAVASFVAPTAITGDCIIGPGCLFLPQSLVSADVKLGAGVVVNCYSSIGHDVVLGDFTTLSAHVDITGRCTVGKRVFFGSGSRVVPGIKIGDDAVIGAGAVVVRDVPAGTTVFGNPARQIA
jgi:sugar O-acyltransferase (sialic acid O-acetyltransferase NeuD family)